MLVSRVGASGDSSVITNYYYLGTGLPHVYTSGDDAPPVSNRHSDSFRLDGVNAAYSVDLTTCYAMPTSF